MLEHTADIRMAVSGTSLSELFNNAARAVGYLMGACDASENLDSIEIKAQAEDEEELFVEWLREILYQAQVNRFIPLKTQTIRIDGNKLTARVEGFRRPPDCEQETEIKAVTYHGLSVVQTEDGYRAHVVFDI